DGTLVQSKIEYTKIKEELKHLLKTLISEEQYIEFISIPRSIIEIISFIAKNDQTGEMNGRAWELVEEYELKGYEDAEIYEDVIPTLTALKEQGNSIAILTNNSRKLTEVALTKFNLSNLVEFVVTRDDVNKPKPDPEGIYRIIEHFNSTKEETIFIGDSWLDAEAAVNARIRFAYFGTDIENKTREKNIEIEKTINKISEIFDIF
ncbi:MAG: HAD family hydrolase, partial [Candidatus Heimdallarchaeaceae archaeon]